MIHYCSATGRSWDLNKLMIKQLNDALEAGQPEHYTQAMFKLTALLISSRGNSFLCVYVCVYVCMYVCMNE